MRDFAKVSPAIWRSSKKFKGLSGDAPRLAYIYILTSPHSNSAGCYALPLLYGSADLSWSEEEFTAAIDELIRAELIEYDWSEEVVFICDWFKKANPPANAKHLLGIINQAWKVPGNLPKSCMRDLADIYYASGWNAGSDIAKAIEDVLKPYRSENSEASSDTVSDTKETETETEKKTETETDTRDTKTKTETNKNSSTKPRGGVRGKGSAKKQTAKPVADDPTPEPEAGPGSSEIEEDPIDSHSEAVERVSVETTGSLVDQVQEVSAVPLDTGGDAPPARDAGEIPAFLDRSKTEPPKPLVNPEPNHLLDALQNTERLRKAAAGKR